jgi:glycerol-3-phosphate dehydrogenase (NAD(P)+)
MPASEHIAIIGNGAMATVCSIIVAQNGHGCTIWGANPDSIAKLKANRENNRLLTGAKIPDSVRLTSDEADAFESATMIVSAIPTQYMRNAWDRLNDFAPATMPIVSVSKGIENGTLLRPTEIITDVLGEIAMLNRPMAALSGPNVAMELAKYLPATAVVASTDDPFARRVQAAFSTQWFRVYTNSDLIGVELAGAMKNVIAIAAGILDGLGAGNNIKAAVVTRGLVEITRLGVAMGASESTFAGLAGLGDLITTCVSPEGRNRSVGEQIGKGRALQAILEQSQSVAEGVPTTRSMVELAEKYSVEMPITRGVYSILFDGKDPRFALIDLMTRAPKPERIAPV